MTDEQDRSSLVSYVAHFSETLLLKLSVADCENFIYNKYLRFQMRSYGKSQAHIHPAGIAFDRSINEFLHSGKINYLIKPRADLGLGHPQNCAVEKNVLASRQFPVQARAHLQEADNPAFDPYLPLSRRSHSGEYFQER